MDQNGLIKLLLARINQALAEQPSWGTFEVSQKFQPTQQGVPMSQGVFVQPMFDYNYGWPGQEKTYDHVKGSFDSTEPQAMESTFQISALVVQHPEDTTGPTAADVVKFLSRALSSRVTIKAFLKSGVSILKVGEIRNDPFLDDRDRSEYHPYFNITFTHNTAYNSAIPKIDRIEGKEYMVLP